MLDTLKLSNSIWPNGIQVDSDGYAVFYPLGTNKVNVPVNSAQWPKGDKLVSPFVYDKDDKVVGFIDTKALTTDSQTTIYLPYKHIDAKFLAIEKGQLQIHAPNAITKKASWKDSGTEDIAEAQFKYKDCKTIDDVKNVQYDFLADIANGTWSEPLWDLEDGSDMFYNHYSLTTFNSDLSSLSNGYEMFYACTALSTFNSDLSSLTNSSSMFFNCYSLTTFNSDLSSLTNGHNMFQYCYGLTTFSSDLSSLTEGSSMFNDCDNLTTFTSDLSSLTNGVGMFDSCENLTTFTSDLPSLTNANRMFQYCSKLTTFNSDLSTLTNGDFMFNWCTNLISFSPDLSTLTNGEYMFNYCSNLISFASDLSSLTKGNFMFSMCSNLKSFSSDLHSLTNGQSMFYNCKLDASSIKNIIDTINTYSGKLSLGMGCNNTTEDKDFFAQEVGYTDMTSLLAALQSKGWTVTAQYNGRPTTTYSLRRTTEPTLPVFVKLEEVEETTDKLKSFHTHTSFDGTKKYRLSWFHETTGSIEGYTQYASLEEAIEALNIKTKIERN